MVLFLKSMSTHYFGHMQLRSRLYTAYGLIIFIVSSVFFLLPQLVLAQRRSWHRTALRFNAPWAWVYFPLLFFRVKINKKYVPSKNQQYILCANHFSFLDIPSTPLIGIPFKYIGKSSVQRIPVFGYMFKKIHIAVDREKLKSRVSSYVQSAAEVSSGFNVLFFPEGGIKSEEPPKMVPFRDGAFRLAIEKRVAILPLAIHNNYRILPDDNKFQLRNYPIQITVLNPIHPTDPAYSNVDDLKKKVYDIIQTELNENR